MAALVLMLLGVGVRLGASWFSARRAAHLAFPVVSGLVEVQGLVESVEVMRNRWGVPHIEASGHGSATGELDAWFGLGFVHAQDRLAQMLWLRRLARGRSAEIIGERGLPSDRLARTLGIGRHGDEQVARLDPEVGRVLEAYARGVNARMGRIEAGLVGVPLEIRDWPDSPRPWTPGDSLALVKLVSWSTSGTLENGIVLSDLIQRLGGLGARPFFPVPGEVQGIGVSLELPSSARVDGHGPFASRGPSVGGSNGSAEVLRRGRVLGEAFLGSSAWVLSGDVTASGVPILVADIQVTLAAPSLVYQAHLRGGRLDAVGATIPGVPVIWVGRNRDVAWAATPALAVTTDLYLETLRDGEELVYHDGLRWSPVEERQEVILVRNFLRGQREETLLVRSTHHGPLIDPLLGGEREPVALAWTGALPGDGVTGMLGVARARDADQILAALRRHHEPAVAMAYADREGRGGIQIAGWIPRRVLPTSLVPVPGRMRAFNWYLPVPFDELPAVRLEGGRDWVIAADNPLDAAVGGAPVEWLWRTGERAQRIHMLLEGRAAQGRIDLRYSVAMQVDQMNASARNVIEAVVSLTGEDERRRSDVREILELLDQWDGGMQVGSTGAVAYHILLDHLLRELFTVPLGEELLARYLSLPHVKPGTIVEGVLLTAARGGAPGGWSDPERVKPALQRSLRQTWVSLSYRLGPNRDRWGWGRLHQLAFRSFEDPDLERPLASARLGPHPVGGDAATLGFADYVPARSFDVRIASTYRVAIDLASPDQMLSALAPGQSEHPRHDHFDDGVMPWLAGRSSLLVTSRLLVEEQTRTRLTLEPST